MKLRSDQEALMQNLWNSMAAHRKAYLLTAIQDWFAEKPENKGRRPDARWSLDPKFTDERDWLLIVDLYSSGRNDCLLGVWELRVEDSGDEFRHIFRVTNTAGSLNIQELRQEFWKITEPPVKNSNGTFQTEKVKTIPLSFKGTTKPIIFHPPDTVFDYFNLVEMLSGILHEYFSRIESIKQKNSVLVHDLAQQLPDLIALINTIHLLSSGKGVVVSGGVADHLLASGTKGDIYALFVNEKELEKRLQALIDIVEASDEREFYHELLEKQFIKARTKASK